MFLKLIIASCLAIAAADPKPGLLAPAAALTYGSAPLLAAPIAQPAGLLQTGYSHVTGQSLVHSAVAAPLTYAASAPAPIAPIGAAVAPALTYAAAPAIVPYQQATFFRQAALPAPLAPVAPAVAVAPQTAVQAVNVAEDVQVQAVPVAAALQVAPAPAVNVARPAALRVSRPFINVSPSINVAQVPVTVAFRGPRPVAPARLTAAAVPVAAAIRVAGPPAPVPVPARLTAVRPIPTARARYTAPRVRSRPAAQAPARAPAAPARLTAAPVPHTVYGVPKQG